MHDSLIELDTLLTRARRVSIDGDRVPLYIRANMTFLEGQNKAAPMVFNIPTGEDFFATRMNLYLASRLLSIAKPDTQSELTFRATDWTSVNEVGYGVGGGSGMYQNKYATCMFEVRSSDGKAYQNAPLAILHAFSDREPQPPNVSSVVVTYQGATTVGIHYYAYAAYIGGLDFVVDERLPAGSSWTVTITPTFSRDIASTSVDQREFMVIGVLTGHKKVKPRV